MQNEKSICTAVSSNLKKVCEPSTHEPVRMCVVLLEPKQARFRRGDLWCPALKKGKPSPKN